MSSATTLNGMPPRRPKNYAATSPITRASGKKKVVAVRCVHNDRLVDALNSQAYSALQLLPAPAPTTTNYATAGSVLRQLANRLVGILHGCLRTRTRYDETIAWSHHAEKTAA